MKKGIWLAGALMGTVLLLVLALGRLNSLVRPAMEPSVIQRTGPLVLDAGHGGEDGGAVSITGTPESEINLAIVLKLRDVLGLYGVDPILLRETDVSLHDSGAGTLREKKRSDLKNRVAAIERVEGGTLLSIHQNSLPSSPVTHGAQVFWNRQEGAKELAAGIQKMLNAAVNAGNDKQPRQIPDSIYLMKSISAPGALVECGFLSNAEEAAFHHD